MTKAAELAKMGEVLDNSQIGRKNIIINGGMQIAQRATSSTGLGASNGYFTLDRFKIALGAGDGRFTMSQSTVTDLEGFSTALKIDCTTADTSIAAGEALLLVQSIEGFNLQQLKATSSSTRAFTLSFYAKSNASRAIASEINLANGGTNVQISKLHTIGTSWARYTMTIPAASITQIDNDNTDEMQVNFWLHAGSTYTGGTLNDDAFDSVTQANRAAGIGSIFASTDNTLEITGMQMEVGSVATPFEHRSYGEELQLCQRYFEIMFRGDTAQSGLRKTSVGAGVWYGANQVLATLLYSPKRAQPTLSQSETGALGFYGNAYFRTSTDSTPFDSITDTGCRLNVESFNASGTAGDGVFAQLVNDNASSVSIDAEL